MSLRDHLNGKTEVRRTHRGPSNLAITLVLACLFGLAALLSGLFIKGEAARVATDPDSLCPTDRPLTEVVVLLLDMSDGFSEAQRLQIHNEIDRLRKSVPRFGLIEAYAVDRLGERVTKPVFHLCNPGDSSDVSAVYQNPDMAQARWSAFEVKLDTELDRLVATEQSSSSPIFEAIQSAAIRTFNAPKYDGVPKRMVLVSDLLQNVPGKLNQYRDHIDYQAFKKTNYFSEVRADLSDVEISLLYLVRPGTPQVLSHILFWEQYFADQGGTVEVVTPIYGAE